MKDYLASLEKMRRDAAEAALIRDLATNKTKRHMFDRLHKHLNRLADEVEKALAASNLHARATRNGLRDAISSHLRE